MCEREGGEGRGGAEQRAQQREGPRRAAVHTCCLFDMQISNDVTSLVVVHTAFTCRVPGKKKKKLVCLFQFHSLPASQSILQVIFYLS